MSPHCGNTHLSPLKETDSQRILRIQMAAFCPQDSSWWLVKPPMINKKYALSQQGFILKPQVLGCFENSATIDRFCYTNPEYYWSRCVVLFSRKFIVLFPFYRHQLSILHHLPKIVHLGGIGLFNKSLATGPITVAPVANGNLQFPNRAGSHVRW